MPLKYMLFQSAVPQEFNERQLFGSITSLSYSNTLTQKLDIPFADYGSMQYFVEKVKYRIFLYTNKCNTMKKMSFFFKMLICY